VVPTEGTSDVASRPQIQRDKASRKFRASVKSRTLLLGSSRRSSVELLTLSEWCGGWNPADCQQHHDFQQIARWLELARTSNRALRP
jgi:hypothetical protein